MERSMISSRSVLLLVAALLVALQLHFMVVNGELHRGGPGGRFLVESDDVNAAASARRLLNANLCGTSKGRAPNYNCASILRKALQPRCCKTGTIHKCTDVNEDNFNCGVCNKLCGSRRDCCAGRCVDKDSDRNNCGRCSNRCPNNLLCQRGQCGY